jgi:hypothetical protein
MHINYEGVVSWVLKTRRQQTPLHPPAVDVMLGPGVLAPAEAEDQGNHSALAP